MKVDIDAAIARCLDHQHWILGSEVNELEEKIAAYLNVNNCVGCSSGTEALVLALRALAIKGTGKEYFERKHLVVTTPFTFILPPKYYGCKPVDIYKKWRGNCCSRQYVCFSEQASSYSNQLSRKSRD